MTISSVKTPAAKQLLIFRKPLKHFHGFITELVSVRGFVEATAKGRVSNRALARIFRIVI
jgi:hypothetical protein